MKEKGRRVAWLPSWESLLMGKRSILIRCCPFSLLASRQIISASEKFLFIATHLNVKCFF